MRISPNQIRSRSSVYFGRLICLCVVVGPVLHSEGRCDETPAKGRFLAEYPAAAARLRAFYGQIRGNGILTARLRNDGSPGEAVLWYDVRFALDSGKARIEREWGTPEDALPQGYQSAVVKGPGTSFRVSRRSKDSPYIVDDIAFDGDISSTTVGYDRDFIRAPMSLLDKPIDELIKSHSFMLGDVQEVEKDGKQTVRVHFRHGPGATASPRRQINGWFELSPGEGWVLERYEYRFSSGSVKSGAISYAQVKVGHPAPERVEYHHTTKRGSSDFEFVFKEFVHAPTDGREFTLAAFGLPGVGSPGRSRFAIQPAYWFFALALVSLAISVALNWARTRLDRG